MSDIDEVSMLLGEIRGELKGINSRLDTQSETLTGINKRLVTVEKRTVRHGAYAGIGVSVGVNVIVAAIREAMKTPGVTS